MRDLNDPLIAFADDDRGAVGLGAALFLIGCHDQPLLHFAEDIVQLLGRPTSLFVLFDIVFKCTDFLPECCCTERFGCVRTLADNRLSRQIAVGHTVGHSLATLFLRALSMVATPAGVISISNNTSLDCSFLGFRFAGEWAAMVLEAGHLEEEFTVLFVNAVGGGGVFTRLIVGDGHSLLLRLAGFDLGSDVARKAGCAFFGFLKRHGDFP